MWASSRNFTQPTHLGRQALDLVKAHRLVRGDQGFDLRPVALVISLGGRHRLGPRIQMSGEFIAPPQSARQRREMTNRQTRSTDDGEPPPAVGAKLQTREVQQVNLPCAYSRAHSLRGRPATTS